MPILSLVLNDMHDGSQTAVRFRRKTTQFSDNDDHFSLPKSTFKFSQQESNKQIPLKTWNPFQKPRKLKTIDADEDNSSESNRTLSLRNTLRNAFQAYKDRQKKVNIIKEKQSE